MSKFMIVAILSLTLIACGQKSQSIDKDKEKISKVCDTLMKLFTEGKSHDALQLLKQNTIMTPASIDTLEVTIDKHMNDFRPVYGKILSYEFIIERKIKDFIAKRFYIIKFENHYLKFDFTLYKGSNGWKITSFAYDEELIELLY